MKKHKWKIISLILIVLVLACSFFNNEKDSKTQDVISTQKVETQKKTDKEEKTEPVQETEKEQQPATVQPATTEETKKNEEYSKNQGMEIDEKTKTDKYHTEPVPIDKPVPKEPEETIVTKEELTCSLTVNCTTALNNADKLQSEKLKLLPQNGIIYSCENITFYEGESVFNVLLREMKKNKIHFEFSKTPIYNSAYLEGISNLYEFDCGELSGWMYKVNDWFPNYGCSRYMLKKGDKIEIVYTCDLGKDIGGYNDLSGE